LWKRKEDERKKKWKKERENVYSGPKSVGKNKRRKWKTFQGRGGNLKKTQREETWRQVNKFDRRNRIQTVNRGNRKRGGCANAWPGSSSMQKTGEVKGRSCEKKRLKKKREDPNKDGTGNENYGPVRKTKIIANQQGQYTSRGKLGEKGEIKHEKMPEGGEIVWKRVTPTTEANKVRLGTRPSRVSRRGGGEREWEPIVQCTACARKKR